ncbi:MAG: hypothetical protein ACHRHE_21435 [Tepidisphaerales bacterium]
MRLAIVVLLFAPLLASIAEPAPQPIVPASTRPPNIVFILAADLGYGDVQCNNPKGKIPDAEHPEIVKELKSLLEKYKHDGRSAPLR